MTKQTLFLFSLLVIVAIIFTVITYLYTNRANALVDKYVSKITVCENITDENTCYQHSFCEGIYRTTANNATTFTSCRRIDIKTQQLLKQQEEVCINTEGSWQRSERGFYCQCPSIPGQRATFDKTAGCSIL